MPSRGTSGEIPNLNTNSKPATIQNTEILTRSLPVNPIPPLSPAAPPPTTLHPPAPSRIPSPSMLTQRVVILVALPPGIQLLEPLGPALGLGRAEPLPATGGQLAGVDELELPGLGAVDLVLELGVAGRLVAAAVGVAGEAGGGVAGALEAQRGEVGAAADAIGAAEGRVGEGGEAGGGGCGGRGAPGGGVGGYLGGWEGRHGCFVLEMN